MGYKLSAKIKNRNSTRSPDDIDLASFGIRIGDEVFAHKFDVGKFQQILDSFARMQEASKKKGTQDKKPMTFSWFVLSEKKTIFQNFKNQKLDIRIIIINQDNNDTWIIAFEEVVLSDPKPDYKDFPGFRRQDERYDSTFIKFVNDPSP